MTTACVSAAVSGLSEEGWLRKSYSMALGASVSSGHRCVWASSDMAYQQYARFASSFTVASTSSRKAFASSFAALNIVARYASKLMTAEKSHVGQECHR